MQEPHTRRGVMLVLSSPSGAGKSTLATKLLESEPGIELSVSVTTRARRGNEVDGIDYHFVTPDRFARMRNHGELLEWAEVHGNFYATPREPVEDALAAGRDVLFDIDWQGTRQLVDAVSDDVVRVFILPPSMTELRTRLERRATDGSEAIERRLRNARAEIAHWDEYDFVIVNADLQKALKTVQSILIAERARRARNPGLASFVQVLLDES